MDYAIETSHLTKAFARHQGWRRFSRVRPVTAVTDVNLQVAYGETFGLLGPNGAGKTTLVKMLCTLIVPGSGTATVGGHPLTRPAAIRAAVGLVVTDERSFYWRLTGRENLSFFAAMYGLQGPVGRERVGEVLAAVEMREHAERRFAAYSTGMKQRLAIARSLLHRPRLLFLDEPTRSLDPLAQRRLHLLLQRLGREREVTIFLITHDLHEAEKLCRRVAVMHQGQVRVVGSPAELRQQMARRLHYQARVSGWQPAVEIPLRQWLPDLTLETGGQGVLLRFTAAEGEQALTAALDCLRRHDVAIDSIEGEPPSLEEVFAYYTEEA